MAGLFTKESRPGARDLRKLLSDPSITVEDIQAAGRDDQRAFRYAMSGLLCGTFSSIACVGCSVYLVMHTHPVVAGIVLAIWPLAIIGDFILTHLNRQRMPR